MKKFKRKWGKWFLSGLVSFLIFFLGVFFLKKDSIKGEDFKIAILADMETGPIK
jgi:uncharacterized membrane protein